MVSRTQSGIAASSAGKSILDSAERLGSGSAETSEAETSGFGSVNRSRSVDPWSVHVGEEVINENEMSKK